MKMNYIRRKWNETRGDEYDHWGNSIWYFETEKDGTVKRQVEEYSIGIIIRYDSEFSHDNYGMLSDMKLDLSDTEFESIPEADFNKKWTERNPSLCQTIDDDKMTIQELEKIEVSLPLSDKFYDEIWSTNLINKLQHLPMKYGPIQDFEEAMILNEGLDSAIKIFKSNKSEFSSSVLKEFESVLKFIKDTKANGNALQFWL
ncbi:hypothetical protein [Carboxylicivirga sp. RSCT41]|uniref:hypothetical protein n=1 Tax=Carboxylicivirga agarovorans TaxID=3417570 RepID=UPI003D3505D8